MDMDFCTAESKDINCADVRAVQKELEQAASTEEARKTGKWQWRGMTMSYAKRPDGTVIVDNRVIVSKDRNGGLHFEFPGLLMVAATANADTRLPNDTGLNVTNMEKEEEEEEKKKQKCPPVDLGVAYWRGYVFASITVAFPTCADVLAYIMLDYLAPKQVHLPPFQLERDRARLAFIDGGNAHPAAYIVTELQPLPDYDRLKRNQLLLVAQPYHRDWKQLLEEEHKQSEQDKGEARFRGEHRRRLPAGTTFSDGTMQLRRAWMALSKEEQRRYMKQLPAPDAPEQAELPGENSFAWGVDRCQLSVDEMEQVSACHGRTKDRNEQLRLKEDIRRMTAVDPAAPPIWYQTRIIVYSRHGTDCDDGCCQSPSHGVSYSYPSPLVSAPLPVPNPITRAWVTSPKWSISQF